VAFPKLKKKEDTPENCLACELQGLKAQRKLDRLLMEKGDREEDMEDVGEVDKEGLAAIDKKIEKAKKKLEVARKEKRDEAMGRKIWCL